MCRTSLLSLLLTAVIALAGCVPIGADTPASPQATSSTPLAETPHNGGVLHYGLTLPVSGIDPHVHANSELGIALSSVYDTLVVQDRDGTFHPSLAESWTISPDGRTYTFVLREGVRFHDGTPFDAASVVRNLNRVADPATKSQKAVFLLGPFESAEAVDARTVRIHLKEPHAALLDGLSQVYLGMASPAALDQWGDQYQMHQVGTGPFRFVSYQERQSIVLERNPDYAWAPAIRAHQGPAYLDRVEFRFYPDAATRLPALLTREAQVMGELPPRDAAQAAEQGWAVLPVAVPGQSVQFMLNTTNPPLDDLKVRQALLYATDRSALVRAVFGPESPMAQGPLTAITRSADPALGQLYPFDLARAKVLLAEAGWIDADGDGILDKGGQPLALDGILMAWGELPAVGTILQAQWRAAGVDLRWEQLPYPAALEAGRNGTHHLIPFVQSGADPGLLAAFFHSRNIGGFNWSRVADPEVDAWLDEAARAADWPEREQRYREVQRRIMEQAWIVPIRDQVNLNAAAPIVKGLTFDVQGWFPALYDVWLASTGER